MPRHFSISAIFRHYHRPKKEEEDMEVEVVKVQVASPEPMQPKDHPLPIAIPGTTKERQTARPPASTANWTNSSSIPAPRRPSDSYRTADVPQPTVHNSLKRQPYREVSWTNTGLPDNYYTIVANSPTKQSPVQPETSRKIPLDYKRKTGAARRASYADASSVLGSFSMMGISQSPGSDMGGLGQIVGEANKQEKRRDSGIPRNEAVSMYAGSPRRLSISVARPKGSDDPQYARSLDMGQARRHSASKSRLHLPQYHGRRHDSLRGDHYRISDEITIQPELHPNGGLGGYQDVQRKSAIGGYRNVARFADIGNDRFVKKTIYYKKFEFDEDIGGPLNHPKPSMIGGPLYNPRRSLIGHPSARNQKEPAVNA
ncbi:hypothetical protein DL89DRAFT_295381 [Linderina pennispora]|uniref:Uncharacterized protein n=1 Tax=Linderina pennispora TaxID=61395 RepID=A0A1Y1W075_9FUNG|nr:uncharacterized protein DL89DRAFT_295381 [Linderina pennispora]ORX66504.1 hypothetical protein DL89DRAFT_295381 [Linderina pennispora]